MGPGLQLLFTTVAQEITVPQDALICFVHWELVSQGYGCLGAGDKPASDETKSELLPTGWNANKELYTLRYCSADDKSEILLKAVMLESSLIINAMDLALEQVVDLTLNVADYIDGDNLKNFHSNGLMERLNHVMKDSLQLALINGLHFSCRTKSSPAKFKDYSRLFRKCDDLSHQLFTTIISQFKSQKPKEEETTVKQEIPIDQDPVRIPPQNPEPSRQPNSEEMNANVLGTEWYPSKFQCGEAMIFYFGADLLTSLEDYWALTFQRLEAPRVRPVFCCVNCNETITVDVPLEQPQAMSINIWEMIRPIQLHQSYCAAMQLSIMKEAVYEN